MERTNPWKEANRERKARALVAEIDRMVAQGHLSPELLDVAVERLPPAWWGKLAESIGKRPPSDETLAIVLSSLRARRAA